MVNIVRILGLIAGKLRLPLPVYALVILGFGPTWAVEYKFGDVFAAVGGGKVRHFDGSGTLLEVLETTSAGFTTGMCFDPSGNLYVTTFNERTIAKFDKSGSLIKYPWGGPFGGSVESCVLSGVGNVYTGEVDGINDIRKFNQAGNFLAAFDPITGPRGSDWIDLAEDQCTMFYTSEGPDIRRFDICNGRQLPNFCSSCGRGFTGMRIAQNGDVFVADRGDGAVHRFDSSGNQTRIYTAVGLSRPFALNLDPDGTSFWTGDMTTGEIFKIDIASGGILLQFNSQPLSSLAGLAVFGERLSGRETMCDDRYDNDRDGEIDCADPDCALDPACNRDHCGDGNLETDEQCDDGNKLSGDCCSADCTVEPSGSPCSDSSACTTKDTCSNGVCEGGSKLDCDDGNDCTSDTCNSATGCLHLPIDAGTTTCGIGACARIVENCVNGTPQACVPGNPSPEACNGIDDDCNGQIDEGLGVGEFSISLSPAILWPPNHRMVDVHSIVTVVENCPTGGQITSVVLSAITSNEPDNAQGAGDGDTVDDIQLAYLGSADFDFQLRAERDGSGTGRVYTVTYTAMDSGGFTSTQTALALVPHDQSGKSEPVNVSVVQSETGTVINWDEVPGALFYSVVRGDLRSLAETEAAITLGKVICIQPKFSAVTTVGHEDHDSPLVGEAFFYLVAYNDGWGSTYGTDSTAKPRVPETGDCQ
jgi:cysteine-rich repeat protein